MEPVPARDREHGAGLTNLEYAPLCEIMGRVRWAPEVFNCSAPDTGNMEMLERYGTPEQKRRWLEPLLDGEIRSGLRHDRARGRLVGRHQHRVRASCATASDYVINGRKWWTSGAGDPRCKIFIVMGKTDPERRPPPPAVDDPGAARHAGRDGRAPRCRCSATTTRRTATWRWCFEDVRVPAANMLLGEGRGFEIAQGRLGPGRIHHCMRLIGVAERALEKMCRRVEARVAFGRPLAEQTVSHERIAEARIGSTRRGC